MGDANLIRTLGDYSRPSHKGYRNTIELPKGNNVVPLRSDIIWETTCMRLFQFSLPDQASNWLKRLPAGSISTWEDLTTCFLAQFFPPGRTAKLRNDIQMFHNIKENLVLEHGLVSRTYSKRTIDQSAGGKLRDKNAEESWALLEDLAIYDNESWNDPRNFAKLVKAISLPQDVLMNKISSSCEICSGPHDTQYCMENPEQAFVEYASRVQTKREYDDSHEEGPEDEGKYDLDGSRK
ncbi:MAK10-like protein [Tanacetum coccineum]